MAIPEYDKFYKTVLEVLSDGEVHNSKETIQYCAEAFDLSEEDKSAMLPSNRQTVLANRVGWARTYLKKAGLIFCPSRGHYKITEAGKEAMQETGANIDNEYLMRFEGFQEFKNPSQPGNAEDTNTDNDVKVNERTPQEIMTAAFQTITAQLADDLMTSIMGQKLSFFERLVGDLLKKMGYGGELINSIEVSGNTEDGGIDGIIHQDALGFDKIYVQAKRWSEDHEVSNQDIQQFAGALMGRGASKGLFITTSRFSKPAKDFVEKNMTANIVLIDGEQLTRLMIEHCIGVNIAYSYNIKKIDTDYFDDEED